MPFESESREKTLRLVRKIQELVNENTALKAILSTVQLPGYPTEGVPGWQRALEEAVQNPEIRRELDERFAGLYRAVGEAMDEHAMLAILLKVPLRGGGKN